MVLVWVGFADSSRVHVNLQAFQEWHEKQQTMALEPNDYSPSNGDFNVRIYGFGIVAVDGGWEIIHIYHYRDKFRVTRTLS